MEANKVVFFTHDIFFLPAFPINEACDFHKMKRLIKKILTESVIRSIRASQSKVLSIMYQKIYRIGVLRYLYGVVHFSYATESMLFLAGRAKFSENNVNRESAGTLRRNIHRLEKGLIMKPRKAKFGVMFIEETVDTYCKLSQGRKISCGELLWATDVLDEYFRVITLDESLTALKERYIQKRDGISAVRNDEVLRLNANRYLPYTSEQRITNDLSIARLESLFGARRSVRWFEEKTVPRDLLCNATRLASLAPSACNRQPYVFKIITDPQLAAQVAECADGTSGFAQNIPSIAIVTGNQSYYGSPRDRHVVYIDASLAIMQFLLALECQGLSSCCINWADVRENEAQLRKIVSLESYEVVVMLIAIGYADSNGGIPYSKKKSHEELLEFV